MTVNLAGELVQLSSLCVGSQWGLTFLRTGGMMWSPPYFRLEVPVATGGSKSSQVGNVCITYILVSLMGYILD